MTNLFGQVDQVARDGQQFVREPVRNRDRSRWRRCRSTPRSHVTLQAAPRAVPSTASSSKTSASLHSQTPALPANLHRNTLRTEPCAQNRVTSLHLLATRPPSDRTSLTVGPCSWRMTAVITTQGWRHNQVFPCSCSIWVKRIKLSTSRFINSQSSWCESDVIASSATTTTWSEHKERSITSFVFWYHNVTVRRQELMPAATHS